MRYAYLETTERFVQQLCRLCLGPDVGSLQKTPIRIFHKDPEVSWGGYADVMVVVVVAVAVAVA